MLAVVKARSKTPKSSIAPRHSLGASQSPPAKHFHRRSVKITQSQDYRDSGSLEIQTVKRVEENGTGVALGSLE
jgi:hypothetical protein